VLAGKVLPVFSHSWGSISARRTRRNALLLVAGLATAAALATTLPLLADDRTDLTLTAVADTSSTAVSYYKAATQAIFYDYTPIKQDHRYTFPTGFPADGFHTYTTEWEPGVQVNYVRVWKRG